MWPWEEKPRILDHLLSQRMNEKQPSSGWSCQSADDSVRWEANLGLCILLSNLCWLFPCFPWRAQSKIHLISVFQQYFENLASLFFSCYFIQEMFFSYNPQRCFQNNCHWQPHKICIKAIDWSLSIRDQWDMRWLHRGSKAHLTLFSLLLGDWPLNPVTRQLCQTITLTFTHSKALVFCLACLWVVPGGDFRRCRGSRRRTGGWVARQTLTLCDIPEMLCVSALNSQWQHPRVWSSHTSSGWVCIAPQQKAMLQQWKKKQKTWMKSQNIKCYTTLYICKYFYMLWNNHTTVLY